MSTRAAMPCGCYWRLLEHLGLPIVWDKLEGLSPCLTFLGFELDSICGEIRLPGQKLTEIRSEVHWWLDRKSCTKRELESLVGCLSHASRVLKPGKTFMQHLFEALTGTRQAHHHVCLSASIRWTSSGSTHLWQSGTG